MFTRPQRAAVALVVALSLAPALAPVGENSARAEAPAARAETTPEAQAKLAYARGAEFYKARKFPEAAAAFTEGHRLKPHYAFLWNLALTYHALGDHQKAIENYQAYLESSPPTAVADRAAAQAAITAEQQSLSAPAPSAAVAQSLGHGSDSPNKTAESNKVWRKWWFWTATGAALAAIGVGLGVGLAPASTAPYREVTWR